MKTLTKGQKTCLSKIRHPTQEDAKTAALKNGLHPYQCVFCHEWHVSKTTSKKIKRRRVLNIAAKKYIKAIQPSCALPRIDE